MAAPKLVAPKPAAPAEPPAEPAIALRDTVTRADVAAVRRIVEASGYFRADEVAVAIELIEDRLAKGVEGSGYHFLFAEQEGEVVGYACFGPIPCTLTSWDLYWIAVAPDLKGRGIGRMLVNRLEDTARANRCLAMYIETSARPLYDSTRAFYVACGYLIEHAFADFYAPGDGKAVYVKRL